jgi:non-specific serine/threonine protein kinase
MEDGGVSGAEDTWPLSAREAAETLGVSERTVRRAIGRGELPATMHAGVYRIAPADLAFYASRRRADPSAAEDSSDFPRLIPFPAQREEESTLRLPRPLTPFIGRERELAAVSALVLRDDTRLVTLVGPGGVGKTRLVLAVAPDLGEAFADGAWFVDLSPLTNAALVPNAIAGVLGVRETGDGSLTDRLETYLVRRELLLLLDNFEGVVAAAAMVAALLVACPRLKMLTTSRVVLNVSGEVRFPVLPLALPDAAEVRTAAAIGEAESVRLFCLRARATQPDFALTDDNAGPVAAICARLDGLPLAIELAAARSAVLAPRALLARLSPSLGLLTGGPRDQPTRLRTMRDAIAWSYDLLSEDEQTLFRCLAVFVGGFTLKAAEAVADGQTDRRTDGCSPVPLSSSVLDGIAALVDASLVRREVGVDGEPRFGMLETIREFGLERLAGSGEEREVRDAHAAYFAGLGGWLEPNHLAPGERADDRLRWIEAEHPNLRAALDHLADRGDAEGVLFLAGWLAVFWHRHGHLGEGRRWLEWALAPTADAPTLARCRAIVGLSLVVWTQGDLETAAPLAGDGLARAEAIGDKELVALATHILGLIANVQRQWDRAQPLMERALTLWRELGLPSDEAIALSVLGRIAFGVGDSAASARYAEESLALHRALGHPSGVMTSLCSLARLARARGDDRSAALAYQEALDQWAGNDGPWATLRALTGLAALAVDHGQAERAVTLLAGVDALLRQGVAPIIPDDGDLDRATAGSRAALGDGRFDELHAAGMALPLNAIIAEAMRVGIPPPGTGPGIPAAARHGLTPRETEVLVLLAAGRSDREIADVLFVSRHTVGNHVVNILGKLGVPSRAAAAAYAVRHGLA